MNELTADAACLAPWRSDLPLKSTWGQTCSLCYFARYKKKVL